MALRTCTNPRAVDEPVGDGAADLTAHRSMSRQRSPDWVFDVEPLGHQVAHGSPRAHAFEPVEPWLPGIEGEARELPEEEGPRLGSRKSPGDLGRLGRLHRDDQIGPQREIKVQDGAAMLRYVDSELSTDGDRVVHRRIVLECVGARRAHLYPLGLVPGEPSQQRRGEG